MPSNSLSIADIIGRAARFMRANFPIAFKPFLVPYFFYVLCWEGMMWSTEHLWARGGNLGPFDIRIISIVACFLAIWVCVVAIRSKYLALWLLMSGQEATLQKANERAHDLRLIPIYFPTIVIELIEAVWSTLLLIIMPELQKANTSRVMEVTLLYFALVIMWLLPFRILAAINLMPAYNVLVTENSMRSGFARFWFYTRRMPLKLFFFAFLLAVVLDSIEVPLMLPSILEAILKQATSLSPELVDWIGIAIRIVMEITIGVSASIICAASIVLLDNECRIRLEGKDMTSDIEKLEVRI